MKRNWWLMALVVLLMGAVACQRGQKAELSYHGPVELSVKKGETIPGTQITYLGIGPQGAEVLISGQKAVKQKGDSLDWKGSPVDGVDLDLSLRALWFDEESLHCGGVFTIKVKDPAPSPVPLPSEGPLKYKALVSYWVKKGDFIPGTTVKYAGQEEEGAKLEGVEGYPYRKTADSIVWTGKLRDRVYILLNVRVVHFDGSSLKVAGTAEIMISP